MIILEFPSEADVRRWLSSPEYRAIATLREAGAEVRAVLVEGCGARGNRGGAMREEGTVVALDGDTARVRIARRDACGGCRACVALGPGEMVVEARNPAGAKVGDRVGVEVTGPGPLRAALLVYGVPLAFFVAGCLAGAAATGSQASGMGIGFAALALAYGALHRYDRRVRKTGAAAAAVVERITDGGKSGNGIYG